MSLSASECARPGGRAASRMMQVDGATSFGGATRFFGFAIARLRMTKQKNRRLAAQSVL
jgi:hypothetical protein